MADFPVMAGIRRKSSKGWKMCVCVCVCVCVCNVWDCSHKIRSFVDKTMSESGICCLRVGNCNG